MLNKKLIKGKKKAFLIVLIIIMVGLITAQVVVLNMSSKSREEKPENYNINPSFLPTSQPTQMTEVTEEETKEETKENTTKEKKTEEQTEEETQENSIVFATEIPPEYPADYNAQWALGYIVAIDNPDYTYECAQVTLTDEDRDLLERLCMGEYGSGGFIGASLIAQAVKDAMCFDGYPTVASVIKNCHYTGSTSIEPSQDCIDAVNYIFDQNHDAVQHRIMYMYNPNLVQSAFHESQNLILTYGEVRFFDRWGY